MSDELHRLRTENQRLRRLLTEHGIAIPSDVDAVVQPTPARAVPPLPPDEKSDCFADSFAVAKTFTQPDGKSGRAKRV